MSLVCMALLFSMKVRTEFKEQAPLLTIRDITELLDFYLPRRNRTESELFAQIEARHRKRQEDLDRRCQEQTGLPEI